MDILNNILSDVGNFALAFFGFSATLFTVLYSFVLAKREQLKELSDRIKIGDLNPILHQRQSNSITYIQSIKKFNKHLIFALFINLSLYVFCMVTKYFILDLSVKKYVVCGVSILIGLIICYLVLILIQTVNKYISSTKI